MLLENNGLINLCVGWCRLRWVGWHGVNAISWTPPCPAMPRQGSLNGPAAASRSQPAGRPNVNTRGLARIERRADLSYFALSAIRMHVSVAPLRQKRPDRFPAPKWIQSRSQVVPEEF